MKFQNPEYLKSMQERYDQDPEAITRKRMHDLKFSLLWFAKHRLSEDKINSIADTLRDWGFFSAPGSTKYHDNYPGGLFEHSNRVAETLVKLTELLSLKWDDPASPYIIGIFHDLCKTDSYIRKGDGTFKYDDGQTLTGHGDKSVILTQKLGIDLTFEEIHCIRWHMGAYEGESNWNALGKAIEEYPNVLYTHMADMVDSRDIHSSLPVLPVYWTPQD